MKKLLLLIAAICPLWAADDFWAFYGDGKAEISSYKTIQTRYGEPREGTTVLVFVPEHLSRTTRIKVEDFSKVAKDDLVQVIKLNRVLRFNTGIYDYAVMTSVFSAIQPEQQREAFYPLKISLSSSEWCGNYYEHLLPEGKEGAQRVVHSYFQAEGDREERLPTPPGETYEDNLFILIREFKGEFLKPGEKKAIQVLPALWQRRMSHVPPGFQAGSISKMDDGKYFNWTWQIGDRTVQCWTDKAYPHYIEKWTSSTGESGERIKTLHLPYWERHGNKDLPLRRELGLMK